MREDDYAEIWHEGRMKGGLFSAGAEAGVELCELPRLASVFTADGDAMVWAGGELTRNARYDLEQIEAAADDPSGGRPRLPYLGGGGFDFD